MHELIYKSIAVNEFSDADIMQLVLQARSRNEAFGITGALIYKQGHFIQLLEGSKECVSDIFRSIENDYRHKSIDLLYEGEINQPWIIPKDTEPGTYTITAKDAFNSAEAVFEIK